MARLPVPAARRQRPRLAVGTIATLGLLAAGAGLLLRGAAEPHHVAAAMVALVAAAACGRASRRDAASARTWQLLEASTIASTLGVLVWSATEPVAGARLQLLLVVPLAAACSAGLIAATFSLPSAPPERTIRVRVVMDGVMVASSLLFLVWPLVGSSYADLSGDLDIVTVLLSMHAVRLAGAAILLAAVARAPAGTRRGFLPLGLALAAWAVGDLVAGIAVHHTGTHPLLVAVWCLGPAGLALAALRGSLPTSRAVRTPLRGVHTLAPHAPVAAALALALTIAVARQRLEGFMLLDGLAIVGLLLASQALAALDNTRLTARLEHEATHDFLTGLHSRVVLVRELDVELSRRRSVAGDGLVLLLLDLDRFKEVNDTLGHAAGDALLVAVSQRLRETCPSRSTDVVRLGGDEFGLILRPSAGRCAATEARHVATRILAVLERPFEIAGRRLHVGASIGIACADRDSDRVSLLRDADAAMYAAKASGTGFQVFEHASRAALVERFELEHDLHHALERKEFVVHYQPIVDLDGERIRRFEALVRWQHPTRGLVAPGAFIPVAEQMGLMPRLGAHVLAIALHDAAGWNVGADEPVGVAVNVSADQLADPALPELIAALLEEVGLDASLLTLELTESLLLRDLAEATVRLQALRALGMHIALDDFGTGYSSLSYLRSLPIDLLKIDRSFVTPLAGADDRALLAGVLQIAEALGLAVVAEGIETDQQHGILLHLGCALGQGFRFSRPLPVEEVAELLRAGDLRRLLLAA